MIDDAIKDHLVTQAQGAYPDLNEKQILVKFPSAAYAFNSAVYNRRNNSGKFSVYEETVSAMLVIASEVKLDRALLVRRLPRKIVVLDGQRALQLCRRVINAELVEVIGYKGLVFYVDYQHVIYET